MSAEEVIPTSASADALDAWCRAHGLDAGTLLDPPPGQAPARLWRQDDWLWWTVPQNLARLVAGKAAEIRWHTRDRSCRVVGTVWVVSPDLPCRDKPDCPKTVDAGMAQLTVGLAWHYKKHAHEQSEQDQERYAFAEHEARAKRAGLWKDPAPVAPWDWRRR